MFYQGFLRQAVVSFSAQVIGWRYKRSSLTVKLSRRVRNNVRNCLFLWRLRHLRRRAKIIYGLTPPPFLRNVGDHAQAVAIRFWFGKHFPDLPVIELHKEDCSDLLSALKRIVTPADIFFLHSGGNLGDRGIWSESRRRLLISSFPNNKIISLPQTIYFSDTPKGREERENSRRIYSAHRNLTVIGRDPESGRLAAELFREARTLCMPDFVLSLPPRPVRRPNDPPRLLLCLRLDNESALTSSQRTELSTALPYECRYFDTTLSQQIPLHRREEVLQETLQLFESSDVVVTDRYHGLIFSVLCRKPTVVLGTVDHKLTSALSWFDEVPFVKLANGVGEVPARVEEVRRIESRAAPDWNERYFDRLPELLEMPRTHPR